MKYIKSNKIILDSLKELNDIVVPTMGARGMLAAISEEMDRPTLTDDGVTVIKQCARMEGWGKVVASGAIEAAHNTEKVAYDGTTLTVMMTYELYKLGYEMIKKGMHPQVAAEKIAAEIEDVIKNLRDSGTNLASEDGVQAVATISTKIPRLGEIIKDAYVKAGLGMNILVEHDRTRNGISIEHVDGYTIHSGYMSDVMKAFCNIEGDVTELENCKVALLKEGIMTQTGITKFFNSIPKEEMGSPIVFMVDPGFNPEALRIIIETVINNSLKCQFVFMNEPQVEDLYLDIAAVTGGKVQDAAVGIKEYLWEHCGMANKIRIEKDKTLITGAGKVTERIKEYNKRLSQDKFSLAESLKILMEQRLSCLTGGITTIMVGVPTIIEFKTLKLKLEDGIGAVREALRRGVQLGGGKALYNLSDKHPLLKGILKRPLTQICYNAGVKPKASLLKNMAVGIDVVSKKYVNLREAGLIDSSASIEEALLNASSIACNYLKTYIIIRERD